MILRKIILPLLLVFICSCTPEQTKQHVQPATSSITYPDFISQFEGIALKAVTQSETTKTASNQHEFSGVKELHNLFGNEKQKFDTLFMYLSDNEKFTDRAKMTWYSMDAPWGGLRYRLYYQNNKVIKKMRGGDLLFIGKLEDEKLFVMIIKGSSDKKAEVMDLLRIEQVGRSGLSVASKQDAISHIIQKEIVKLTGKKLPPRPQKVAQKPTKPTTKPSADKSLTPLNVGLYRDAKKRIIVSGSVTAIKDGDTIVIEDLFNVRMYGMDAPEKYQKCRDKKGAEYKCGIKSKEHLTKLIGKRKVTCISHGTGKYGRFVFACTNSRGVDVNGDMVAQGWAVSEYGDDYKDEEKKAKKARKGIWQGRFIKPQDWRKGKRL